MTFTSLNEIEISGGSAEDRRAAAALVLAADSADEDGATTEGGDGFLRIRFGSVDGLPEDELAALAPQFPALGFTLVYFSLDGEFYGHARAGAAGDTAESADLTDDDREAVGRRHDGDGLAFVRACYDLSRR